MALALVFPVVFHAVDLGNAFLPMFYPIIAAGFLVALPAAVVVGARGVVGFREQVLSSGPNQNGVHINGADPVDSLGDKTNLARYGKSKSLGS